MGIQFLLSWFRSETYDKLVRILRLFRSTVTISALHPSILYLFWILFYLPELFHEREGIQEVVQSQIHKIFYNWWHNVVCDFYMSFMILPPFKDA